MPLPMQGNKLLPGGQDIIRRSLRPGPPNRGGGDRLVNSRGRLGKSPAVELGHHGRPVRRAPVSENVDHLALELGGFGLAKLYRRELLQMLVQEPGVIDDSLQDERLTRRNGGAMRAMHGARGKLRARGDIGLSEGTRGGWRMARSQRRIAPDPAAWI